MGNQPGLLRRLQLSANPDCWKAATRIVAQTKRIRQQVSEMNRVEERRDEFEELVNSQAAEIERLREVVEKLPKTADGVQFIPNIRQKLWWHDGDGGFWHCFDVECDSQGRWWCDAAQRLVSECYSSREAAQAAAAKETSDA